jgi:plastocyanin
MMHTKTRWQRRTSICVALLIAAITSGLVSARAEDAAVKIHNFAFTPPSLTVKAGTVTWRNEDDIPHTTTSSARVFKSKALDTGDNFSFTFNDAGSYEYFCSLHPHMKGTIVLEPASHAAK